MRIKKFLKHALYVKHEEILLKADLHKPVNYPTDNGIIVQSIGKGDQVFLLESYRKSNVCELYAKTRIERYFASGCKCFMATKDNNFIGHFWWGNNKMLFENCDPALRYVGETYALKEGDVLAIDFFVVPEERGGGVALEFLSKALLSLEKLGYDRCLGLVLPHNRSARWTYMLCGFDELARVKVRRLLNYMVLIGRKLYISPHALSS